MKYNSKYILPAFIFLPKTDTTVIPLCLRAQLSRSPADYSGASSDQEHCWAQVQKAAAVCDDFRVKVVRNVKNEER